MCRVGEEAVRFVVECGAVLPTRAIRRSSPWRGRIWGQNCTRFV